MLTKKHIEKLNNTVPTSSIWNGNFKRAVIECKCNKLYAVLELHSTILELERYTVTSAKNKELSLWIGGRYSKIKEENISVELQPAIQALKSAVEFTEEEKQECVSGMRQALKEFREAFYPEDN